MSYRKRPSTGSVSSNLSASSVSSSAPSSASITRPSSLASALPPEIVEDEDDDEPYISIGPEIVDEHPFDPSLPDEVHLQMIMMKMQQANSQPPTPSASIYDRLARMVPNHSLKTGSHDPRAGSWRSKLRFRRQSSEGPQDAVVRTGPSQKREAVPEPGVVLSCNFNPTTHWGLVPLGAAQEREDIVRRAEGFEMDERKRGTAS